VQRAARIFEVVIYAPEIIAQRDGECGFQELDIERDKGGALKKDIKERI
jgi:hypothetical protein